MKRILLSAILTIFFSAMLPAQSKMNFDLAKKVQRNDGADRSQPIDVFIKGDVKTIKSLVMNNGGAFKYSAGDISVVKLSVNQIGKIINNKAIKRVEAYPPRLHPLNDTMLVNSNIIEIHNGQSPLTQSYDGTGVVVGFLDTGIDYNHPDFKDSTGKSRIKYLWDQTLPSGSKSPLPFNYGQEFTNTDIDNGLAGAHSDIPGSGHGTHVAGVGVGNGLATGGYKGVAPGADIIMVAIDFNSSSPTLNTDAVNYIYSKAQEMGKPCVINASLGDYFGSHDGKDLQAQLINNMIEAQPGRAFVAAAGNAGNFPFHLSYNVTADTNLTMFNGGGNDIYIQLWADTNDFKNVDFAIGADQMSPSHAFKGYLPFTDITSHLGIFSQDTLFYNGKKIGVVESYGDLVGGTYSMEFYIMPDSQSYNWRLSMTGSGKFDLWSFEIVNGGLPSVSDMPEMVYYKYPDIFQTIVSSFQCLDNVIAVGNYTNRRGYIDYNNTPFINPTLVPGARVDNSSVGPTRDGRIKPDVVAPGDMTMAAVALGLVPNIVANYPDALALGGYHVRTGGSSHASPVVAGIAALYLQKFPTATAMEVKQAILSCAKQDQFTGSSLPNNYWGYGKANGFGALTVCATSVDEAQDKQRLLIYPNPLFAGGSFMIAVPGFRSVKGCILKIYNALGETVKTVSVNGTTTQINIELTAGIYFCNLMVNERSIATEKLVVLE